MGTGVRLAPELTFPTFYHLIRSIQFHLHGWKHANIHCSAVPLTAMQTLLTGRKSHLLYFHQAVSGCLFCSLEDLYLQCQRNHACMHPAPTPASHTAYPSWMPIGTLGSSHSSSALLRIKGRMRTQDNNSTQNSKNRT